MGTNNLYENGPNPFFLFGTKNMVKVKLMATVPNKNSHQVFKTRRVRYERPDELELYSSSTTPPVKCRHQLMLRFYSCSRVVGG